MNCTKIKGAADCGDKNQICQKIGAKFSTAILDLVKSTIGITIEGFLLDWYESF